MTEYNFAAKFKDAPTGAFTSANKAKVWPPDQGFSIYDPDPDGKYFSLVDDDRLGGRCCRMKYPAGAYGMGSQFYQLRIKNPKTEAILEFDWLAEDGFQFCPPNDNKNAGGKLGPCLNSGEVGGASEKRGTRAMMWWNGHGSNYPNAKFSPSCQDQASGNQLVQPVVYTATVETERVYHWKIKIKGGTNGTASYELDGKVIATVGPKNLKATDDDDMLLDFAFFAGGASKDYAPQWDCYARHGNVKWYTAGSDSGSGGGDGGDGGDTGGGTDPQPPQPEPAPDEPSSHFSIAVGEEKVLSAVFWDDKVFPPAVIEATQPVKWYVSPGNALSWGASVDPMSSQIKVTGKTVAQAATCYAIDPSSGVKSEIMIFDITDAPRQPTVRKGKVELTSDVE